MESLDCGCISETLSSLGNEWCNSRGQSAFMVEKRCDLHLNKFNIPPDGYMHRYILYFFECRRVIIMKDFTDWDEYGDNCTPSELYKSFKCSRHLNLDEQLKELSNQINELKEKYRKLLYQEASPIKEEITKEEMKEEMKKKLYL